MVSYVCMLLNEKSVNIQVTIIPHWRNTTFIISNGNDKLSFITLKHTGGG